MKKLLNFCLISAMVLTYACQDRHLIPNNEQREEVSKRFEKRMTLVKATDPSIDSILSSNLTQEEREAFEFLFAYMPLSDLGMHSGNYVFDQVRTALQARETFPWGKEVPNQTFLHFVLPYRVNNEDTDSARQVFFKELAPRLKGLSMYDAALEVNHWCHEKVIYKPSDARTSGPLTTIRTAFGRCGEESTFTVAAMRSVGIPARQVYTPRWAHTDDNHAWVEVWVDGKWHFLGACEPEPELDMAWFAAPVKRAMMARTFVFGKYYGEEEILTETDLYSEINLTPNYAPTKKLHVVVVNENGMSEENTQVAFKLYNYAEFYPLAVKTTDKKGSCSLITGYGDLIVWATKDNKTGFAKASQDQTEITITLSENPCFEDMDFTVNPPKFQPVNTVSEAEVAKNNQRLQKEDSIRQKYVDTFMDSSKIVAWTQKYGFNSNQLQDILVNSRGNWEAITSFLQNQPETSKDLAIALLNSVAEKDLHDLTESILQDHLVGAKIFFENKVVSKENMLVQYVLSPRIEREYITPWRTALQKAFSKDEVAAFRNNIGNLVNWITQNINLDNENNYYGVRLSPEAVLRLKICDVISRNVFFVACCRTFGIPARIETSTKQPQYWKENTWIDVNFKTEENDSEKTSQTPKGTLKLILPANSLVEKPQYYIHYTIAKQENGQFNSLDFETDPSMNHFPASTNLAPGQYRLITGNRQVGGAVLCRVKYLRIEEGKTCTLTLDFNTTGGEDSRLYGMLDTSTPFTDLQGQAIGVVEDFVKDKPLVLAIIDPNKEPTRHLINDMAAVKQNFEQWGGNVIFIIAKDKLPHVFKPENYKQLPEQIIFGYDNRQIVNQAIANACSKSISANYPVVTVIKSKGEVVFYSEGYSIGLGEQILKALKK